MEVAVRQKKSKMFYYRRAVWENQKDHKSSLQDLLQVAHNKLSTAGKRTFKVNGGLLRGAFHLKDDGFFIQIVHYDPGTPTSIINSDSNIASSSVSIHDAPTGSDYVKGDVFVYVKGNHVVLCATNSLRENSALKYFAQILKSSDKECIVNRTLELNKIANTNKVKTIENEGVKKIILDSSLYAATHNRIAKSNPTMSTALKAAGKQILDMFTKDPSLSEITTKESLNIKLELNFDGRGAASNKRTKGYGEDGKLRLKKSAIDILNDENEDTGFQIHTNSGTVINSSEIRVSQIYEVETLGNSLCKSSAMKQLQDFYDRLKKDGVLQQ